MGSALRQQGAPVSKYYESWSKVKEEETLKVMSDQVKMDDYNFIPKINNKKSKDKPIEEFKGIFGDDDDSDQDDVERFELKQDRNRKRKEASPVQMEENTDSSISK